MVRHLGGTTRDALERIEHAGLVIQIEQDEDAWRDGPRTWGNFTKLAWYTRRDRYNKEVDFSFTPGEFGSWEEFDEAVMREYPGCVMLPVYKYEHSGIAYSTEDFNDRWDSGRVGFILATREDVLREYSRKRMTKALVVKVEALLRSEVEVYSQWSNGEVYAYSIMDPEDDDEIIDSCCGFYGFDYVVEQAKEMAESLAKDLPTPEERREQREREIQESEQRRAGQLVLCC